MKLSTMFFCGLALSAGLILAGCGKNDAETETPVSPVSPKKNADNGGNTDPIQKKPDTPALSTAELKKQVLDKAWAYFDKNYNQGNPNPKNDKEDLARDTWGPNANPAFTSFIVLGGLKTGKLTIDDPRCQDSVISIMERQQASGSFDIVPGTGFRSVYTTSSCVELFAWLRDNGPDNWKKKVSQPVAKAMDFLKRAQVGGAGGPMADATAAGNPYYGGWAYSEQELADTKRTGGNPAANMSTTIFALDAAAAFGLAKDDPLWGAATTFLSRNQNSGEVEKGVEILDGKGRTVGDPPAGSPHEGGSRYSPTSSMAGEETLDDGTVLPRSYGSMTYALLRGYLHAGLPKSDTRVQLAYRWLKANFDVTKVPGYVNTAEIPDADKQGYYYQFLQMSRTLALYGEEKFEDVRGNTREWKREMLEQLSRLQKEDGSFSIHNPRWMEASPVLCGMYILNALAEIK
jgi:hypothetical protein